MPDLDRWIEAPAVRVRHSRASSAGPAELWTAAQGVRLADTALLGRLVRLRIPGLAAELCFDELFRRPPFVVLEELAHGLVSGLVGRIWTLRRDYPELAGPDEFAAWDQPGTARVMFANWADPAGAGRGELIVEVRVQALGTQGRIGVAAVRPLVLAFQNLVGSEGISAAVRRAERR